MLTREQIEAGKAVRRALERYEAEHERTPRLVDLHESLAALRESFKDQLSPEDYIALGGGTPKTPVPDEG